MERIREPEIMNDMEQAIAYAKADFSESNQRFVDNLLKDFKPYLNNVLDIGCGPADIPIRLAKAAPAVRITAIDGSDAMVGLAQKAVKDAGLDMQIKVVKGYLPGIALEKHSYDVIISNGLLHHLPNPLALWEEVKKLAKQGAAIYIMDLFRPQSAEQAKKIVEKVSGSEHPLLKRDFYNSLLAAYTIEEIKEQLRQEGLGLNVAQVSERHLLVKGLIKGAE